MTNNEYVTQLKLIQEIINKELEDLIRYVSEYLNNENEVDGYDKLYKYYE